MIGCLPDPHPDEIFYSICARFSDRMQYTKKQAVIRDLFARNAISAVVDLPTCLDALTRNLPPGHRYTTDMFIERHTLLPFYAPFLAPERLRRLREDMQGERGQGLRMRIGITAHAVPLPTYLRFCPLCAEEDRQQLGEYYWHRIHQVPGILVCPIHHVFIQDSSLPVRDLASYRVFITAQRGMALTSPKGLNPSDPCHATLLKVARDVAWLLQRRDLIFDGMTRYQRYTHTFKEHDFVTPQGLVRLSELCQAFKAYYSPDLLSTLHCELSGRIEENWLARLVHRSDALSSVQHPLHHLLLIQFLGYDAQTFFAYPSEENGAYHSHQENYPFGEGPWPCLNITCSHYQKPLIPVCQISYSHRRERRPIGVFSCSCGFAYSRTGPETSLEDRFRIGKIKTFGQVWERTLQELWENHQYSLDQIASTLGVTRNTVKIYAARLGLAQRESKVRAHEPRWIHMPTFLSAEQVEEQKYVQRDAYRAVWLSVVSEATELMSHCSSEEIRAARKWLSRNDARWLNEHPRPERLRQSRVDWQRRDHCLAEEVRAAANCLKNLPGYPSLISISAIRRNLNKSAMLLNHLERLPLTSQVLAEVVESYEQWNIRRIWWAAELYRQERLSPTQGQLVRRARVEYYYYSNVLCVKETVDAALQTFGTESVLYGTTSPMPS